MKRSAIIALAVASASASASAGIFQKRQVYDGPDSEDPEEQFSYYISDVCRPRNSTGGLDFNAPCNAMLAIQSQCEYGPNAFEKMFLIQPVDDGDIELDDPPMLSNETQRACICQSQHTDMMMGCLACYKEHGGTDEEVLKAPDQIQTAMDAYCKADEPATQQFEEVFMNAIGADDDETTYISPSTSASSTTFSDPIGNSTAVSLYYTPSVTGTAAYMPAVPTPESSGGDDASYTSTSVSDGQIVPTAAGSEGKASESDSGAAQTAMAQVGAMGAAGIAALMAAL